MKAAKDTIIHILGPINTSTLKIIPKIRESVEKSPDSTIKLIISSGGGHEDVGFAIYDTLKLLPGKLITHGYGQVCSIATLIFQAGHTRLLSQNCLYMMHNGSVELGNNGSIQFDEIENLRGFLKRGNDKYYKAMSQRTKQSIDKIKQWCDKERYFNAQEAIKFNLADQIVRKL